MACALVPLDEQQVTEPGPLGREVTLPALVSQLNSTYSLYWWNGDVQYMYSTVKHQTWALYKPTNISTVSWSAPTQEGRALLCALQGPTRRWLCCCWGGGVFGTCQIYHRGPGMAAVAAARQVLVSGEGSAMCERCRWLCECCVFLMIILLRWFASTRLCLMNLCRDVWIRTCVTLLAA